MSTATVSAVEELAHRYDEAWNAHDLDRILALHAPDMTFHLHLPGFTEISGEDALREHFNEFFALWPDLEFRSHRLTADDGMFANEMMMSGTLAAPMTAGDLTLTPNGQKASFESVDVIVVEGGRVKRKDTYVDSASLLMQLETAR